MKVNQVWHKRFRQILMYRLNHSSPFPTLKKKKWRKKGKTTTNEKKSTHLKEEVTLYTPTKKRQVLNTAERTYHVVRFG